MLQVESLVGLAMWIQLVPCELLSIKQTVVDTGEGADGDELPIVLIE